MLAIQIKKLLCFIFPKKLPIKITSSRHKCLSDFKMMNQRVVKKYGWKVFFFGDQRAELTIVKANFPENTFCYVNQGSVSLVKGGENALYLDFVVLCQLMPAANVNPKIDLNSYVLKENEVIMYCPVNNKSTGMYGGLTRKLGYITLRKDDRERFYSYGFNKEKTSSFYCHMKTPLPNIFSFIAFKKHLPLLLDENQNKAKFSNMFFTCHQLLIEKKIF